jgi:transcriptional regulator with XRE-family HTH domain
MIRIKELRNKKKMNQVELARILGIAPNTLSYWEREEYQPDNESLKRIAEYFNVTIDYLLGVTNKPDRVAPDILKDYGVKWGSVFKNARAKGLTPDDLNKIIDIVSKSK